MRILSAVFLCSSLVALGQDVESPKFVFSGGAGAATSSAGAQTSVQFVGDFEEAVAARPGHAPFGFLFEGGYAGPTARFSAGSGIFSANYLGQIDLRGSRSDLNIHPGVVLPFFTGGYTRLFGTGNAVNFGGGIDLGVSRGAALRFEVRDYLRLSGPKDHDVAFRAGIVHFLRD